MKIENNKDFEISDIFIILMNSIFLFGLFYIIIFSMVGMILYFNVFNDYPLNSVDKLIINSVVNSYSLIAFISIIVSILSTFMYKFKAIFEYSCLICNKRHYEDSKEIIILNKKEVQDDIEPRIVCKHHKKPYTINVQKNWCGK